MTPLSTPQARHMTRRATSSSHTPQRAENGSAKPNWHQISAVTAIDSRLSGKRTPQVQWNSEFPLPSLAFVMVSGSVQLIKSPILGLPATPGLGQPPTWGKTTSLCGIPTFPLHREREE